MPLIALRFISGKYKGGEYILSETKETYIGRSSEIDLVLMEDMVSRKHARIWIQDEKIHLEDFGSTNGTFVNGEKISSTVVNRGDRILIGTSIMKVVETERSSRRTEANLGPIPQQATGSGTEKIGSHTVSSMSGTIDEVPLPDLIQLLSTSKKTGTLIVQRSETSCKIHLDKGQLIYASIDDYPQLPPLKAMVRILSWNTGTFELVGPESRSFPELMDLPTEHILMEGLRQIDEIRHMENKLPPLDAELVIVTPLMPALADLSREELNIIQLIHNYGTVQEVLDRAEAEDSNTANIILGLTKRNYIAQV